MRRIVPIAVLVAGAVGLGAGCGGGGSSGSAPTTTAAETTAGTAATGTLNGSVGPGFDISMDKTSVAAGVYTLNVDDQSSMHDFHLTGPGVDVTTDVSTTGKKSFRITLKPGTYTFVCDPHSSSMHGTLTVS
jgi:plastocyanin